MGTRRAYGTGSLYLKEGHWYGRWRTPLGRQARRIGPAGRGGLTKKDAERRLREIMLVETSTSTRRGDDPTIEELGRALLGTLESHGRKRSHVESARYHLSKHIDPLLGDMSVSDVVEDDVRRLIERMRNRGLAAKTIRNVHGTLHSLLGLAVEQRIIDRNPASHVRLPKVRPEPTIRFLTQGELELVLQASPPADASQAERDWWPVVRLLVLTGAMTGMRLGELRALRWSDLDYGAMKVRVRRAYVRGEFREPKSRRSVRAIPLARRLLSELEQHHRQTVWNNDEDLVLAHPHTGRPLDRVRLLQHFKAALVRANVRPVRIHDLRHTFATTVAASGEVSLRTLQEWLGHLDARTTQIYADYMPGEREAELVDRAFSGGQLVANFAHTPQSPTPQTP
jgi:integrase